MDNSRNDKSNLSKNLLQMKFMQRSALRVQKEDYESEHKKFIDDEHWKLDLPEMKQKESKYIVEPSFVFCEQLKFGRMSFKGFNPEIEKLAQCEDLNQELAEAEAREQELGVDDVEMAERYSSLVGTIGKKFSQKRHIIYDSEGDEESLETKTPTANDSKKSKYSVDKRKKSSADGRHKPKNNKSGRYY